ncbi:MAG: ATP-binding protein [bacterium]|nr:MAG: ATP-binding protein [bacterium]
MEGINLHILNLQPDLQREFFAETKLPNDITVKSYKTYSRFMKSLQPDTETVVNILLFIPDDTFEHEKVRRIRLAALDAPIYIVARGCSERDYLTYLSIGISGVFHPPFSQIDIKRVLNGRMIDEIPFPRNHELAKEGQVRLDFMIPSKLSRVLGVNRLVSFLTSEFGFPPEDAKVNLPLVMDEALTNAILHGNKANEELKVHVRIYISSSRIRIQVEDQGEGFIPNGEIDPTTHEHLFKASGRGIYLIRELMDGVLFKKGGRIIEMEMKNSLSSQ